MDGGEFKVRMNSGCPVAWESFLVLLWTTSSVFGGPVVYVNQAATGTNDGSSWTDAYVDLQPAFDVAEASGGSIREIWVAAGTYKPSKRTDPDDPRSATFQLIDGVSLYGGFDRTEASIDERDIDANPTILSGDFNGDDGPDFVNYDENAYHVVTAIGVSNATTFDGLTVTSGHAPGSGFLGSYGGGMHAENAHLEIRNCSFTRNLAERPEGNVAWSGGGGAALYLYQEHQEPGPPPLNVSRSRFTDNRSAGDGGAVFLHGHYGVGSATFTECSFERNDGNGAFIAYAGGEQTFRSCTFSDNSSINMGGAIYSNYYESELLIDQCRFEGNTAGSGGAVAVYGGRDVTIRGSIFLDNSAENGKAGALYIYVFRTPSVLVELVDNEFRSNSAEIAGGAYLHAYTSITVRGCQFVDNWATDWHAGGLYVDRSPAVLSDCDFVDNHARGSGGGLFADGFLDVTACTFTGNNAWEQGGAVFASSYEAVRFEDTKFDGNRADYGGAVYIYGGRAMLDRCRVARNEAVIGGGVAAFEGNPDLQLVSSLFADNWASAYGGGIAAGEGELSVRNCTITNNRAGALGAGMIVGRDTAIANSIVWGNIVDPSGEEVWTDEVAQIDGIEFADIQYSDVQGWSGAYGGDGNIGLNPLFVEPVDPDGFYGPLEPDYRLKADSPCINAGLTETIDWGIWDPSPPYLDLDNKPRELCKFVDMGAYEFGLLGDVDCNLLVDLADFAHWSTCVTGPDSKVGLLPGCEAFDSDGDSDIDLRDLAGFLQVFSPATP